MGPERNPIRNRFGFILSSFARLVDLWTTAARGIQGDYCCQATADLKQCAYMVQLHHDDHASVLMLHSQTGIPAASFEAFAESERASEGADGLTMLS